MSIIQAVITDNFCLMSGDSRATYSNNNTCKSGFNKVIKLNNQILFGVTEIQYIVLNYLMAIVFMIQKRDL